MSEMKDCPYCGETIKAVAIKCRFCKERLDGKPRRTGPEAHFEGNRLIMPFGASLPGDRCIRCSSPANRMMQRTFYWHEPYLYLLILAGVLIYAVVALIIRKRATVKFALCEECRSWRNKNLAIGWILGIGSIVMMVAGCMGMSERNPGALAFIGLFGGLIALIVGVYLGNKAANIVMPARIDDHEVHLKGAHQRFLAEYE